LARSWSKCHTNQQLTHRLMSDLLQTIFLWEGNLVWLLVYQICCDGKIS
jgi:hypothetical protein